MCLFPHGNTNINGAAYKKGVTEFGCGACPECLSKRARLWSLRCSAEAKRSKACMITLTYDSYIYDENGNIIGENVADRSVDKKDAQDFIKRLRSHYDDKVRGKISVDIKRAIRAAFLNSPVKEKFKSYRDFRHRYILRAYKDEIDEYRKTRFENERIKIKYLLSAEYGKRTHRPHYHAILFGIDFAEDREFYKKSKRGNAIFMSPTLTKVWNKGICTVDCVNVTSKVARYCTKYCAKDARADDTFMLVSRGIGDEVLMEDFNGLYYMVDGNEYPIPKLIWNKYILKSYPQYPNISTKYQSLLSLVDKYGTHKAFEIFDENRMRRRAFQAVRDADFAYQKYLAYWQERGKLYDKFRGSRLQRILALPNDKYFAYKQAALRVYSHRFDDIQPIPPRSNAKKRYLADLWRYSRITLLEDGTFYVHHSKNICPSPPCLIRANDRQKELFAKNKVIKRADGKTVVLHFKPAWGYISPFGEKFYRKY